MIVCQFCGGPHVWWDCRKKPEGWLPPKKTPVETIHPLEAQLAQPIVEAGNAVIASKKGRPATGFDKKAYDRERMRKQRAK